MSPATVTDAVKMVIAHLGLIDQRPRWLEFVDPVSFQPAQQECHLNVLLKMIHERGDIQHGWILAEDADQGFVEGQFHSVWKSPSGVLVDVTPRKDMEHRVLFVPDPIRFVTFEEHPLGAKISTFDNCRFCADASSLSLRRKKELLPAI